MATKTTTSAQYGHRTIGTAEELGLDSSGGKWAVVCEDHKTVVNTPTQKAAKATATVEFCEECRSPERADHNCVITVEEAEEAPETAEQTEATEPTTEPVEQPEKPADAVKDWRGNYNTVFAPGAELVAARRSNVEARTVSVSAMLKETHIVGSDAKSFLDELAELESAALAALRTWQKTQDRKGQTDMEKYNQNRSFLAGYMAAATGARKVPTVAFAADMEKALRPDAHAAGVAARRTSK